MEQNKIITLILTDFNLDANFTGEQFVRKVKSVYKSQGIPPPVCYLISGEDMDEATNPDFDHILQKPYQFPRFTSVIMEWYEDYLEKAREDARSSIQLPSEFFDKDQGGLETKKDLENGDEKGLGVEDDKDALDVDRLETDVKSHQEKFGKDGLGKKSQEFDYCVSDISVPVNQKIPGRGVVPRKRGAVGKAFK